MYPWTMALKRKSHARKLTTTSDISDGANTPISPISAISTPAITVCLLNFFSVSLSN